MKRTKQQKEKFNQGITLVALVVTIVVLLILAGVSLNLVLGENGIISKAREASTKTVQAQQNSEIEMNLLEQELANATKEPDPAEGVKMPTGFYYVGGTKTSGIVISDNVNDKDKYKNKAVVGTDLLGNQYVWIPCTTDSTSSKLQYARTEWGVEEDGDDNSRAIKDELTLTDASVTYSDADTANGINADVSKEIVAQIKAEKTSVAKYGGYYIGRYEVGKNGDTAVVKYNQTPYASITWSTAYGLAKKIITNSEATSYLCSSYAWDTAVNFIQNNSTAKNYATSIEGFNGNWNPQAVKDPSGNVIKPAGTSQQLNTGLTTQFCNIFDMGGNEAEFTTELNPGTSETVVLRGGSYYTNIPAGYRWDDGSGDVDIVYGFRATLFLK
ncbi:MAG: type II secretion system protein [Clostridia bacterium]